MKKKAKVVEETRIVYIDGTDWQHDIKGTTVDVYPSIEAITGAKKCVKDCGIVEVEVKLKRWVKPQDFMSGMNKKS